jgi:hypothetical protein
VLSQKTFPEEYVEAARRRTDAHLATLVAADPDAALCQQVLENIVLALELTFVHRMRGQEGKDGNPLNEVRMLADSIVTNGGVLAAEPSIKYRADRAVLGLDLGDRITLDVDGVQRLAAAFFDTLGERYGEP